MLPIHPFRNSLYISLALSILSVGVAAYDLLPEFPFITAFCLMLLGLAYSLEGRYELNLRDANLFGLLLSMLLGLWGIFQFVRKPTGLSELLPWPASALPYLAPVLMVLIPAKLFRSKHMGDYWTMHGLGLLSVSLACAMASDGIFVLVFIAYAVSFVWGLAMFQIYRKVGSDLSLTVPLVRPRRREIGPAIVRTFLVGLVALPLFWLTPRTGASWQLGLNNRQAQVGLSDGNIDMTGTGTLEINREKVFSVYVTDQNGDPVLELPSELRWRVSGLQDYSPNHWKRDATSRFQLAGKVFTPLEQPKDESIKSMVPNFGPNARYFQFVINKKKEHSHQPVADPVVWKHEETSPIVGKYLLFDELRRQKFETQRNWAQRDDGTFDGITQQTDYVQAWAAPADMNRSQLLYLYQQPTSLTAIPKELSRLKAFSNKLLHRLVDDGKLPAEVIDETDPVTNGIASKHHETVAKAFTTYFASSGEFTYSLDRVRIDKQIDRVEDFVLNVRSGHCTLFASALALTLRTLGISTQLVTGYRGWESREDGWYDVREDHAHAWVEVLVKATPDPATYPKRLPFGIQPQNLHAYRWVTFDPTPSGGDVGDAPPPSFLSAAKEKWEATLKAILLSYNKDARDANAKATREWLIDDLGWVKIVMVLGTLFFLRQIWLRWKTKRAELIARSTMPSYLLGLYDLAAKHGLERPAEQTPLEFAIEIQTRLQSVPNLAPLADIPIRLVKAYYTVRFGKCQLTADEVTSLNADLHQLATAMG